jgi:hypothetical protein
VPNRVGSSAGRPHLLSDTDKRKITCDITSGKYDTAVQATASLAHNAGVVVNVKTVRRALKESGLHAAPKVKKPMLSKCHHKTCLEFAQCYKDWTVEDWHKVVWSDETKINHFGSYGRKWCWKGHGEALSNRTCQPTVKHGGGSLMVWSYMTAQGTGYLTRIDGNMNADLYC